jgi:hypothetical protein
MATTRLQLLKFILQWQIENLQQWSHQTP